MSIEFNDEEIEEIAEKAKLKPIEIVGIIFIMNNIQNDRKNALQREKLEHYHSNPGDYVG